jgi:uncharacterized protein
LGLSVIPQYWVKSVLKRHGRPRADLTYTGASFARHVLDGMKLGHVKVEESRQGDHYDPAAKAVRLMPERFNGRSLAAMVVAAHEIGHAMQDATDYAPLKARHQSVTTAARIQQIGGIVMLAAPLLMIITKSPAVLGLELIAGALMMLSAALIHVRTLPVEFDASFNRAMPLLEEGGFLAKPDRAAAREILRAAAFTYVASALMTLLDITRWLRVLRV